MDYYFEWMALEDGYYLIGRYSQTVWGETLSEAIAYLESFHGTFGKEVDGITLELTFAGSDVEEDYVEIPLDPNSSWYTIGEDHTADEPAQEIERNEK
jgi:hypothetical protein